ncbi:MAG: DMT family transporter [Nitrososphaerales archaeon]
MSGEATTPVVAGAQPATKVPARWSGLGLVVLATACWSTAGLFITSLVRDGGFTPLGLAFWRMLVTSLCLFAYLAVRHPRQLRVRLADVPWFATMGVLAVATFQVAWIFAVLINGPSIATIIQCNAPIIVTVIARIIWSESLTWQKWTAIGLASLGTVLIAWPNDTSGMHLTLAGFLISMASAVAYAGITLFTKRLARDYSSWTILAFAFAFAALALLPFQFGSGVGSVLPQIAGGRVLVTFGGFVLITTIAGYALYATGLHWLPASVASIAAMSEVPFAAAFGFLFLGDRLSPLQVLGGVIVVSAVVLLSLRPERAPAEHSAQDVETPAAS